MQGREVFGPVQSPSAGFEEVNMNIENVLDEYRNGDDSKRLSLFLAYRELRDHFNRIEQESTHDDFVIIRFPWWRSKRDLPRAA